jgi:xanthine dehydrogenase small subunit
VLRLFKVSQRKDLDISCVNAGFKVRLLNGKMKEVCLAYGGVGPTVLRLKKTERYLIGKKPSREVIEEAARMIRSEVSPLSDVRGTAEYRSLLCENLFRRFSSESLGVE